MRASIGVSLVFAVVAVVCGSSAAQPADHPPCWHAEFDAFAFLQGEWTVHAEDRLGDGTWETSDARCWISPAFDGCALVEHYVGTRAGKRFEARGMFGFNSVTTALQHMWIDGEHGMLTTYEGRRAGDEIVLDYRMVLRGQPTILRDVYSEISRDSFRIEGRRSNDDGRTWNVTTKMRFTRAPQAAPVEPQPTVELPAELSRVLADYEDAWRRKDEDALAALFAVDGFVLSGGGAPIRGREAIRKHYAESGGPLSLRALAWSTEGSVGFIIGGYARERGQEDVGKFTLTLRKERDGRWMIMSDMDNSNQP